NAYSSWFGKSGTSEWTSNYPYQVGDTYKWGFLWLNGTKVVHEGFENFAAVFYSGSKAVEDYDVDGAALRDKLLANSAYVGGELLNDRYSKYLFEDYVQNGYEYGYNRKEIKADDMLDVFWHITTKNLWQTIFGGYDVETIYDSKKAIEKLSDSDLSGSDSEIAESLYVNINDVKSIKDEYAKAKSNGETLVLFRYSTTRYMCAPCTATYCRKADVDNGKTLVKTNCEAFGDYDYNSYVAQETVYLDFDIISLWFTADGVETEIPVVASPSDVIHGLQPPLEEDYHNGKVKSTFLLILGLIVGFILLLVLSPVIVPILTFLVKALLWLITLPFKAIGAVFKGIGELVKINKRGD
ncbi:MAG: hypothetical protein K2I79_03810, partial [Clostridia bacterium]|nr:hypothetical protein [Clostridia bacterium]